MDDSFDNVLMFPHPVMRPLEILDLRASQRFGTTRTGRKWHLVDGPRFAWLAKCGVTVGGSVRLAQGLRPYSSDVCRTCMKMAVRDHGECPF